VWRRAESVLKKKHLVEERNPANHREEDFSVTRLEYALVFLVWKFGRSIFSTWMFINSEQKLSDFFGNILSISKPLLQTFYMFKLSSYTFLFQKGFFQTHLHKFHCLTTLSIPCFESS